MNDYLYTSEELEVAEIGTEYVLVDLRLANILTGNISSTAK